MPRLVRDRYLPLDNEHVCDLATGAQIRFDDVKDVPTPPIEADIAPYVEAMSHGRDGWPRWVVATPCRATTAGSVIERVAAVATARGFVAISPDHYLRLRDALAADLDDRTLLLTSDASDDQCRAHAALIDAAARSPRPHVLITCDRGGDRPQSHVREARASYGEVRRPEVRRDLVAGLDVEIQRARTLANRGRHAAADRALADLGGRLARRSVGAQAARVGIARAQLLTERGRLTLADAILAEAARLAMLDREEGLAVEARVWQAVGRIAMGLFLEAESICRAVLARDEPLAGLQRFAQAVLVDALLWQGRAFDPDVLDAQGTLANDDSLVAATVHALAVRRLVASSRLFEAGQRVAELKRLMSRGDPLVDVLGNAADLEVLAAAGDLVRAEETLRLSVAGARAARAPLRSAWATLTYADALNRARRGDEARRLLRSLRRLERIAPPLLQREIRRREAGKVTGEVQVAPASRISNCFSVSLVNAARDGDDDEAVLRTLCERLSGALRTSRIDLVCADAGPVSTMLFVGEGCATTLGSRALEAAFPIGPEQVWGGRELAVPVRLGARVLGAIACRWPVDWPVPADAGELIEVTAAVAAPRLEALLAVARESSAASLSVPELIGESEAIADVRRAVVRAAAAPFGVLIEGESGVGKELAARALHQLGARRDRPFCDLNCAALPDELLESELFGHAKGAFSGAVTDRAGLFEAADGGTLFLDEVADLSPRAQAKLLRVIQQQEVRRVGETFSRPVDVRLVAAANRDMRAEAAVGHFRHDLLYRLDVIRIRMPPLRERPDDIPALAARFWRIAAARVGTRAELSPGVIAELARYHWPGNVRELQNVIAALAVAAPARGRVRAALLPPVIGAATSVSSGRLADARQQFERRFVEVALARASGSRTVAARSLGLSRQGLLKTMARIGLPTPGTVAQSARGQTARAVDGTVARARSATSRTL